MRTVKIILTISMAAFAILCQAVEFNDNGKWGVVKTEAYEGTIFKNGSFMLDVKNTVKVNCSFIRCWVSFQRFPMVQKMSAGRSESTDGKTLTFKFKYIRDEGSITQTLEFTCRGVTASYEYIPQAERDLRYLISLIEISGKPAQNFWYQCMDASKNGILKRIDAESKSAMSMKGISLRDAGTYTLDFCAERTGLFNIEKFPAIMLRDHGGAGWRSIYQKDEPKDMTFSIFISKSDGTNLQESKVIFAEEAKNR